ncbi:MAG TPA: ATP-binding protein [Leptospiraceae bacterium]|nr:ATP-binding protein [Leptospiraceae bacterium]HNF24775.1 ATP-binding protein [Leptospiraceae bacterium]HNI96320.1 ATP-binding protein [Leptospiraceae bacterium]HNM02399.1 ATP-binding protein [Leptospiraceae bacterium]HNN04610.1 ATP-binding protein [Leptospiraceae bacterium]
MMTVFACLLILLNRILFMLSVSNPGSVFITCFSALFLAAALFLLRNGNHYRAFHIISLESVIYSFLLAGFGDLKLKALAFVWFLLGIFFHREFHFRRKGISALISFLCFAVISAAGETGQLPVLFSADMGLLLFLSAFPVLFLFEIRLGSPIQYDFSSLETILDSMPINIFIKDMEGKFIFVNAHSEKTLGKSRNEILGKTDYHFFPKETADEIVQYDREAVKKKGETVSRTEELFPGRFYLAGKRLVTLPDEGQGILGFSIDISQTVKAEEELVHQKILFTNLMNTNPSLIFVKDIQGRFLLLNKAVEELFEKPAEEILFRNNYEIHDFVPEVDAYTRIDRQVIETGEVITVVESHTSVSGKKRWFRTIKAPIAMNDGSMNVLGVSTDITEIVQKEEELIRAKDAAEKSARIKSEFLSTMSHEIRTPLNAVVGITNILLSEEHLPAQTENLKTLGFSAEHLLTLVNDILDYNKIEAGKVVLESIELNLPMLVSNIRQSMTARANELSNELTLILDENIPETIVGDPFRLSQILTNLISNAVKFTSGGRVDLRVGVSEIMKNKARIFFSVEDTGIGIPKEKIESIFLGFTQADSSTARKFGGTGLGLAITKKLLELFKSEIHLESEPGKGTKVFFEILFETRTKNKERTQNKDQGTTMEFSDKKILIIDDYIVNLNIAKKFLAKIGIEPDLAAAGPDALEMLKEKDYDLIFLDLQMPEMDGFEVCRRIRKLNERYAEIPIIALTAAFVSEVQDRIIEAGMNDILAKPFKPEELHSIVFKWTGKSS